MLTFLLLFLAVVTGNLASAAIGGAILPRVIPRLVAMLPEQPKPTPPKRSPGRPRKPKAEKPEAPLPEAQDSLKLSPASEG